MPNEFQRDKDIKAFVVNLVRVCANSARLGFRFEYGRMHNSSVAFNESAVTTHGALVLGIHGLNESVHARFVLVRAGESWTNGDLTIEYDGLTWQFNFRVKPDGVTVATPAWISHRQAVLRSAIQQSLADLGDTRKGLCLRLEDFGYTPDLRGLKSYIGEVFGVEARLSFGETALFSLDITRGNDPNWLLLNVTLPQTVREFIADQLALAG